MNLSGFLHRLAIESATQPLSDPVPGETAEYFVDLIGASRLGWRTLRRRGVLWASGQLPLKRDAIPAEWRRILWLYEGEYQVGDALMDLAPRTLLVEQGRQVDLLATPVVAALFEGDPWFGKVGSTGIATHRWPAQGYDGAIVLASRHRPLKSKRTTYASLPWVSLHDHFTGPNFHRGLFAARRLADLLGIELSADDLQRHGVQKLGPVPAGNAAAAGIPRGAVVLAVGGVHAERTYAHWDAVVAALLAAGDSVPAVVLVGSANGREAADALLHRYGATGCILDTTARLSLTEVRAVMDQAGLVVCADGGLMHLAVTTRADIVSLFPRTIDAAWRLPVPSQRHALQSPTDAVSAIPPADVAGAILQAHRHSP